LAGIGSFGSEEVLCLFFVFVRISEVDLNERTASSGVMEDSADDSSDVALSFGVVEVAISRRSDSVRLGGGVDAALFAFSLA